MASKIDSKNHNAEHHQRLKENQQSDNRFGKKSRSMFFIRHTAHPKNLRFITGVGGIQVCAMKEDNYNLPDNVLDQIRTNTLAAASVNSSLLSSQRSIENYISDPKYELKFDYSSSFNQDLLKKYEKKIVTKHRKERVLPPIKHWTSTYMIADDTKRWKCELNNLAKKVGIMTNEEVETSEEPASQQSQQANKSSKGDGFELRNVKSIEFQRSLTHVPSTSNNNNSNSTCASNQSLVKHTANTSRSKKYAQEDSSNQYDRIKTGRFNEPRSSALGMRKLASSRMRTSLNFSVNTSKTSTTSCNPNRVILCNEESEREMWLLQILCQILNTESMQDIQSWLVSSGTQEKEAMKELIQKALEGLNQSGRIELEKFSLNPNDKTTQVDFEQIKNSITSMIENTKNVQFANSNNINNSINNLIINESKTDESTQTNVNNNNTDNIIGKLNIKLQAIESLTKKEELKQSEIAAIKEEPKQAVKDEDEENPFACGSEFKSVSLINMDPYKFERTRTLSTFEDYLSKSTYFQSKIRQMNQSCIASSSKLESRPYTCKDAKQDQVTLDLLNNRLSRKLINKFTRVELVDIKPKSNLTTSTTTATNTTTNSNKITASDTSAHAASESAVDSSSKQVDLKTQTIKKTASFFKPEESVVLNSTNVKLKLEANKDTQVLTIEDN